jgi:anthranilate phosphoribosyltransferase
MSTSFLKTTVATFGRGRDLDGDDADEFLDALITESDEVLMAELFRAWDKKGIAESEIYSIAKLMRHRCTKIESKHDRLIDIVGTGGSRAKTFNVSTAAAFVVAGTGVAVAKHGNKAATSNSGSADVLSALGIEPAVDAATAERCLNDIGICFMFAPNFHRLSPTLGKVRRGLGFPTIFNCVGPLCNPASAPYQLIGVWSKEMVPKMAGALVRLGTKRSWVVHGLDGLDEISLSAKTLVAEVEEGSLQTFEISPADLSFDSLPLDQCRVASAEESAALIRHVLENRVNDTAARLLVLINAAAGAFITGQAHNLTEAAEIVEQSLTSGAALGKLDQLAAAVRV